MANNIHIAITRPGKSTVYTEIPSGETVEYSLNKAGLNESDYNGWSFTDEDGDTLDLADSLSNSTALICGPRVDGAQH